MARPPVTHAPCRDRRAQPTHRGKRVGPMTKPVKVSFEGDESDLTRSLDKAGAGLDDFAADAKAAGDKAESALSGVGDKADAVGSATSQAAGGLGDLGGALALMPGPLGAV